MAYYLHSDDDFLKSPKRLFNRRGSGDSNSSDTSLPLNAEAPIFVPSPKKASARKPLLPPPPTSRETKEEHNLTSSPPGKPQHYPNRRRKKRSTSRNCRYCIETQQPQDMYESHCMRHPRTKALICPLLLGNLCKNCGDTFDRYVHEATNCPLGGFRPFIVSKL